MTDARSHIERAVIDILTFSLGMRPLLTAHDLRNLVEWRISRAREEAGAN